MAPYLTHLVVGERVWFSLDGRRPTQQDYGTFLFGCLAPDMDKLCDGLEQATTHFVAKDSAGDWVWRRSQRFLDRQTDFLRVPYPELSAGEQAFVLGYLCHVATDETTGRLARVLRRHFSATGGSMPSVDAIATAMDPRFWVMVADSRGVLAALETATIPSQILAFAPPECLKAMYRSIVPQVQEGGGLEPFLRTIRRQRQWMRHGRVSDAADDPELEAELSAFRRHIEANMPAAERLVEDLQLESFVEQAASYSLERLRLLLVEKEEQ